MTQADGSKLKLMVVDDEPDNLDLLYRTFRRDFEVFKAESAAAALQLLDLEGEMGIIISDQRMPKMNGTEFLSLTTEQFPDTIRILLTGYTDAEDLVGAINTGRVFKYVTKPWSPDQLKSIVHQAADTYRVLKQRTSELNRALRRESLFNAITTAIRGSLDYRSMLQTLVDTVGPSFDADQCLLYPIDARDTEDQAYSIAADCFRCQPNPTAEVIEVECPEILLSMVLRDRHIQPLGSTHLIVPLTYQQNLLAILVLSRQPQTPPWSEEDLHLLQGLAEQAALAISQARLYQRIQEQTQQMRAELAVARQIQSNLLPQQLPELEHVKIQACCYPAREVGGDFFEVLVHPNGDIWVGVGDVSGKGVPAALLMASAISILRRELAQDTPPEPNIVMQNLNSSLSDNLVASNCFITMVLARYTPVMQQLVYANAGHIYPMVWSQLLLTLQDASDGAIALEPIYLKVRGIPLGILPNWQAAAGTLTLKSGDVLLLTSDGITEATLIQQSSPPLSSSAMLQQAGLWQMLTEENGALNLDTLLTRIQTQTQPQEDDQTILALEVL